MGLPCLLLSGYFSAFSTRFLELLSAVIFEKVPLRIALFDRWNHKAVDALWYMKQKQNWKVITPLEEGK